MKKKAGTHHLNSPSAPSLKKIAFLFCTSSGENKSKGIIHDSVKRLKKDFRDPSFFIFVDGPSAAGEAETGEEPGEPSFVQVVTRETVLPSAAGGLDYVVLMEAGGISKEINFNEFFHDQQAFPALDSWAEVYMKNQAPGTPAWIIIGRKTAEYLISMTANREVTCREDVLWYLRRLHPEKGKIFTGIESPYGGKPWINKIFISPLPLFRRWFRWNFPVALEEYKSHKKYGFASESSLLRPLFITALLLTLVILPLISYRAGISGDEEKHWLQAEKVYNYFSSGGKDTLALTDPTYKLNYYGQSFDLLTYIFIKTFHIKNIYETRHVLNGFTGALTIITAALLVRLLIGYGAGILSLFLLFFSPRLLGHAMNNPLDIPFALGYIFTILQMVRFLKRLPEFSVKIAILIALGIAFTISIRIGGLILVPYLFLFSSIYLIYNKWPWTFMSNGYLKFIRKGLVYLVIISLSAYFISLLPWPYALKSPLKNPFNALKMMSNITVSLRVMFEGKIIWSDNLPWYYIPKNILITVPIVILVFFAVPLFTFYRNRDKVNPFWIFMLYFASLFPVVYIIYKGSNVYGGWRHVLFIYPALVILATTGIIWIRDLFPGRWLRSAFILIIVAAMTGPVIHIFRNFPLQYIYYNRLVGGVEKASKKYETDYYLVSLKPGTEWIRENILPGQKSEVSVISNAPSATVQYYFRDESGKVSLPYTRYYDRGVYNWDYAVFFMNYIDPYQIRNGIWPPKNTIHEVKVDDVPVCAVVKRENRDDYYGVLKLNEGIREKDGSKVVEGIRLLDKAMQYDKNNEVSYLSAAHGYILLGQFEKARQKLHALLSIYPNYDKALNLIGYSYLMESENNRDPILIDRAMVIFNQVINFNYKNSQAFYYLGLAYMLKGDDEQALNFFNKTLGLNPRYKDAYYSIATMLEKRGEHAEALRYRKYADSL